MRTLLTIAGFDPSSGAGVTADLATFAAHGYFGTACITALTVQSTWGVRATQPVDAALVGSTLECLEDDLSAAGIKIGMLADAANLAAVASFLDGARAVHPQRCVVLDPVLCSSSGRTLLPPSALEAVHTKLLPLVGWITPNVDELAALTGVPGLERESLLSAARTLQARHPGLGLVVTGGHMDPPDDLLVPPTGGTPVWIAGKPRLQSRSTHGTGCAFSSAFLCHIVRGLDAHAAAQGAKSYVYQAIQSAPGLGHGFGPLNHLWTRPLEISEDPR